VGDATAPDVGGVANSGIANIQDITFAGFDGGVSWVAEDRGGWPQRWWVVVTLVPDLPKVSLRHGTHTPVAGITYHTGGMPWMDPGYTAFDKTDGDLTAAVVVTGDFMTGWQNGEDYVVGDLVVLDRRLFECFEDHTAHFDNNRPRYSVAWQDVWEEDLEMNEKFDLASGERTVNYMVPGTYVITYTVTNSTDATSFEVRTMEITEIPPDEFFLEHFPEPSDEANFCFIGSVLAN
jgi:hypothetical protein